jgi:hypothetical protein
VVGGDALGRGVSSEFGDEHGPPRPLLVPPGAADLRVSLVGVRKLAEGDRRRCRFALGSEFGKQLGLDAGPNLPGLPDAGFPVLGVRGLAVDLTRCGDHPARWLGDAGDLVLVDNRPESEVTVTVSALAASDAGGYSSSGALAGHQSSSGFFPSSNSNTFALFGSSAVNRNSQGLSGSVSFSRPMFIVGPVLGGWVLGRSSFGMGAPFRSLERRC